MFTEVHYPASLSPRVVDMFLPRHVAISAGFTSPSPTDECVQIVCTNGGCCPFKSVVSSQGRNASLHGGFESENMEHGMNGAPTEEEPILECENEFQEQKTKREGNCDEEGSTEQRDEARKREGNCDEEGSTEQQDEARKREGNCDEQESTEQQDEDGADARLSIVERDMNSEVATTAPVSDSIPSKRRREARMNSVVTEEEPIRKKTKEAEDSKAQPKMRQQRQHPQPKLQLQQQEREKKPKKDYVFPYGNYHRYYGYRLGRTVDEDPRLKYFRKEWFEGKDCLDVGCNEGFITISIAQKYACRSILGVDIDKFLIAKATSNLKEADKATDAVKDGQPPEEGRLEETVSLRACDNAAESCDMRSGNQSTLDLSSEGSRSGFGSLLQKVNFRREQFIEDFPDGDYMKDGMFDTVTCLSVTKWIHLNWGDVGLIRLFAKIFHILRPGGVLILEPQPWKSYKKKSDVSEVTKLNYENIYLTPTHFREVLLDKIGFKSVEKVIQAVPNSSLGFDRSLFLYGK